MGGKGKKHKKVGVSLGFNLFSPSEIAYLAFLTPLRWLFTPFAAAAPKAEAPQRREGDAAGGGRMREQIYNNILHLKPIKNLFPSLATKILLTPAQNTREKNLRGRATPRSDGRRKSGGRTRLFPKWIQLRLVAPSLQGKSSTGQ